MKKIGDLINTMLMPVFASWEMLNDFARKLYKIFSMTPAATIFRHPDYYDKVKNFCQDFLFSKKILGSNS